MTEEKQLTPLFNYCQGELILYIAEKHRKTLREAAGIYADVYASRFREEWFGDRDNRDGIVRRFMDSIDGKVTE